MPLCNSTDRKRLQSKSTNYFSSMRVCQSTEGLIQKPGRIVNHMVNCMVVLIYSQVIIKPEKMDMVVVKTEVSIEQPIEVVARYAENPDNATKWYKNIKTSKVLTSLPLKVGTKISFEASFLGKKLDYTYEVTKYTPQKLLVMQTSNGPFLMETTYLWEALSATSTKMTLINAGYPSGFSRFVSPIMSLAMKRENTKDLKRVKTILESK